MTEELSVQSIESIFPLCHHADRLYLGFSGGVDSHVLLHLCASIASLNAKLVAIYVHHGLQVEADFWAEHCQRTCEALGVACQIVRVNAQPIQGQSPEEAARNARYDALKAFVQSNDVLLVAQHREDQLETVLLQLFRGSGLKGLSAMPACIPFGSGTLLRPLLDVSKQAINSYAIANELSWIEDPSNLSSDYDRNFLRNEVLPLLKQRWPAVDKTVSRSAKHCAEAQSLISVQAKAAFLDVFVSVDQSLCVRSLQQYQKPLQALILREWFQVLGLKMPSQAVVERIQSELIAARVDSDPLLQGRDYCLRRYRDKLYCLKLGVFKPVIEKQWPKELDWVACSAHQRLGITPSLSGIGVVAWQSATVTVRPRQGGERIRLPYRQGRHALKQLFQEANIPPWQRESMPLVYLDDQLAAVGDLWISADFYQEENQGLACVRLCLE